MRVYIYLMHRCWHKEALYEYLPRFPRRHQTEHFLHTGSLSRNALTAGVSSWHRRCPRTPRHQLDPSHVESQELLESCHLFPGTASRLPLRRSRPELQPGRPLRQNRKLLQTRQQRWLRRGCCNSSSFFFFNQNRASFPLCKQDKV